MGWDEPMSLVVTLERKTLPLELSSLLNLLSMPAVNIKVTVYPDIKIKDCRNSLVVQWLGASTADGTGLTSGQETEWKWKLLSRVRLFATPCTMQSMEFSRTEYWSEQPFLLQGIFPTQGSNPGLPHCRQILYQVSRKEGPRILGWVACPFSSWSSWRRSRTRVSCIAGRFFTN